MDVVPFVMEREEKGKEKREEKREEGSFVGEFSDSVEVFFLNNFSSFLLLFITNYLLL